MTGSFLGLAAASLLAGTAGQRPGPAEVAQAIALRRARVEEFQLIKRAAGELGLRVWLFGGTAAGFAHYVRWDLEREGGDARYPPAFFDYDFTNIYRSTQDADLVVDGTPQQAAALERLVRERMGFLQGSKENWEVRLLRQDRLAPNGQVKQALLANPDFLNQHTDSNSTGMIELTDPPAGQGVVRDLRDWESWEPIFLQDLAAGRLHYYWNESHVETSRFRTGDNPPLFSVIRYLVKAFQYGLAIDGEDRARIGRIIDDFDPARDPQAMSEWARGWLERYGPNLIRHSVDIERAWNTLESLGLRRKLIALSAPSREGSLGWWLSKEPLRSRRVGEGQGPTAAELGLTMVAHETRTFVDYESITRDMKGRPNVLISRDGKPGENAALGAGFYTREGRDGGWGTGLPIRFRVDPRARAGSDFTVHGDVVIFQNRDALTVIPESLEVSALEYFEMLRDGAVDPKDRGVGMKLRRRLALRPLGAAEEARIVGLVLKVIEEAGRFESFTRESLLPVLTEWLESPRSQGHPEVAEALRAAISRGIERPEVREPDWQKEDLAALFRVWVRFPEAHAHPEVIERMLELRSFDRLLADALLSRPEWSDHPEYARTLVERGLEGMVLSRALVHPEWARDPDLMRSVVEKMTAPGYFAGAWDATTTQSMLFRALSLPQWNEGQSDLMRLFVERASMTDATWVMNVGLLWVDRPELILTLIARLASDPAFLEPRLDTVHMQVEELVRSEAYARNPILRALCGGRSPTVLRLLEGLQQSARVRAGEMAQSLALISQRDGASACP